MIITRLSSTPGGSLADLQRQEITAPAGALPLRVFRRTLHLRVSSGGLAESIQVEPAAQLRGTFGALDYDALTAAEPALRATISPLAGGVLVEMDTPRRILRITIPSLRAGPGSKLELYRLDGDTPAGEPTLTVTRQNEALLAQKGSSAVGIGLTRSAGARAAVGIGTGIIHSDEADFDQVYLQRSAVFPVDFTDARFLLRLTGSTGSALTLNVGDVETVRVRGYPTNPRIGLSVPPTPDETADPGAAVFFWRATGEVGNGTPASAGIADAGDALSAELARALARLVEAIGDAAGSGAPPHLPQHIDAALVLESDAPCVLQPASTGEPFRLEHHAVRRSFDDGAPKRVLRFEAGRSASHQLSLTLPASVALRKASLELDVSVAADRAGGSGTGGAPGGGGTGGGSLGVRITSGRPVAQRVQLAEAMSVSSAAVAVMAATARAEAMLALREDAGGVPEGRVLAEGALSLGRPGEIAWSSIALARPAVVSTAPHWLVLSVSSGSAVWLGASNGGGLRAFNDGVGWSDLEEPTLAALHELRTRAGSAADAPPALELSLGSTATPLTPLENGRFVADLSAAAQPLVSAGAPGALVSVTLSVAGSARGVVTLYPPHVVYD